MKKKFYSPSTILVFIIISLGTSVCKAQSKSSVDKDYIISNLQNTVVRIFLSQKFAPFTISSPNSDKDLNYKSNSKLNFGAGITYKNITGNFSYGFKFLNKDRGEGKTKGLDLQFHIFPHKWSVDLLGSFLTGYYLDPGDNNGLSLTNYYQRPDIKRNVVGFGLYRVPNADKFSYKAAVTQSEWQIKSAGSLLYGGEAYYGKIKGDSSLVPLKVYNNFTQAGVSDLHFFSVGIGGGYAYTLVIKENFFVSGSVVGTVDGNFSSEATGTNKKSKFTIVPGGQFKGSVGYNSNDWSVSTNFIGNALFSGSAYTSKRYFLPTGNMKFTVAKKIGTYKYKDFY